MEFTSQIVTTKEQSNILLSFGLNKVTADCVITSLGSKDRLIHTGEPITLIEGFKSKRIPCYPAWSLDRLLEMIPDVITFEYKFDKNIEDVEYNFVMLNKISFQYENIDLNKVLVSFNNESLYESIIECITWLIKTGLFNKKFLN